MKCGIRKAERKENVECGNKKNAEGGIRNGESENRRKIGMGKAECENRKNK